MSIQYLTEITEHIVTQICALYAASGTGQHVFQQTTTLISVGKARTMTGQCNNEHYI